MNANAKRYDFIDLNDSSFFVFMVWSGLLFVCVFWWHYGLHCVVVVVLFKMRYLEHVCLLGDVVFFIAY